MLTPAKLSLRQARKIITRAFPKHTVSVSYTLWRSTPSYEGAKPTCYSAINIGIQPGLDGTACQHLVNSYSLSIGKAVATALAHPSAVAYLATR